MTVYTPEYSARKLKQIIKTTNRCWYWDSYLLIECECRLLVVFLAQ